MKLYRIVHGEYSSLHSAFCGYGASCFGGRWNNEGMEAIYTSTTIKTAVAEKGFYAIIQKAYMYRDKKLTAYERSQLLDNPFVLLEAEFDTSLAKKNNFTDKKILSFKLRLASLPNRKPRESILSPWNKLPGKWTVRLGAYVYGLREEGEYVSSARFRNGKNYVFYNDHYLFTKIKLLRQSQVFLSASDCKKSEKWNGVGRFSLDHIFFEVPELELNGTVKVEDLAVG